MKIISLVKLAAETGYIVEGGRNLLGAIQHTRSMEENFAALDQLHHGAFAFLAFHPASDQQVVDYINEGSLGNDAGSHILALFLEAQSVPQALRALRDTDVRHGVNLSLDEHPAYALVRQFFPGQSRPRLPGLMFFDAVSAPTQSIYIPLDGTDGAMIKADCRKAFEAAERSPRKNKNDKDTDTWQLDFDKFSAQLIGLDISYRRAGEKGVRSAGFVAGAWIKKNAGAIVAAIPKLVDLVGKQ